MEYLELSHEPIISTTSYNEDYEKKNFDQKFTYHQQDSLHLEGTFIGERRKDYCATATREKPLIKKPIDNLKTEGDFDGIQ